MEAQSFYKKVKRVHLEATTRCNAACPQCLRNYWGGPDRVGVGSDELSLADVKKIFPPQFLQQLELLYVNGNFGDGAVARDIMEIFEYFRSSAPHLHLMLFTNGSVRTPDWWTKIATYVNEVFWGIDGLEDTNHLYRRHTNFNKIMENARAFNQAGGKSNWVFNVFRHNEHQIEQARSKSVELGFFSFQVRKTARFEHHGSLFDRMPVLKKDGSIDYYIEVPTESDLKNSGYNDDMKKVGTFSVSSLQKIIEYELALQTKKIPPSEYPPSVYDWYSGVEIDCQAIKEQSIYISAAGEVYPCCWIGQHVPLVSPSVHKISKMVETLPDGREGINAKQKPITEIINNLFFQNVKKSWTRSDKPEDMVVTCAQACSKNKGDCFRKQMV